MSAILSSSQPVSRADAPAASGPWIYRPWLDLLVGCGGLSAPLLLLAFYFSDSYSRAWTVAFYFLALLFNYPHFMATVYRAYHTRTEFAKYRIFTVHVALLLAAAGLATHLWYPLLPWIFTIYICWSPWHYTGQNFGLMIIRAARRRFARPRGAPLPSSGVCGVVSSAAAELSYRPIERSAGDFSRPARKAHGARARRSGHFLPRLRCLGISVHGAAFSISVHDAVSCARDHTISVVPSAGCHRIAPFARHSANPL